MANIPNRGLAGGAGPGRLTTREFWDARHARDSGPDRPLPLRRHLDAELERFFRRHLGGRAGDSILEVGCGASVWLAEFVRDYGLIATGLDYSAAGLARSRRILDARGVQACLVHGDALDPGLTFEPRFDVVFSLGVVEHFADPAAVLRRLGDFLGPGGLLLTWVPNVFALAARLSRRLAPATRGLHVPARLNDWRRFHAEAGLVLREAYAGQPFDLSLVNLLRFPPAVRKIAGLGVRGLGWPVLTWQRIARTRGRFPESLCAGFFFAAEKPRPPAR